MPICVVGVVLILVVMEDSLGLYEENIFFRRRDVLILVVMEDSLGLGSNGNKRVCTSLNPCCNGR